MNCTAVETLRDIETTLLALCEIDPEDLNPELRKEYERDLLEAIRKAPEKRERVAVKLFDLGQRAAVKRAAADAHRQRAKELEASAARYESDVDRLKDYVLEVMRELPEPKKGKTRILEGMSATFKAAKVPDSVEIYNDGALPEEFRTATITVPFLVYRELVAKYSKEEIKDLGFIAFLDSVPQFGRVDKSEIKHALQEPCQICQGRGELRYAVQAEGLPQSAECKACGGTGLNRVPGVRLVAGKLRLVVE